MNDFVPMHCRASAFHIELSKATRHHDASLTCSWHIVGFFMLQVTFTNSIVCRPYAAPVHPPVIRVGLLSNAIQNTFKMTYLVGPETCDPREGSGRDCSRSALQRGRICRKVEGT